MAEMSDEVFLEACKEPYMTMKDLQKRFDLSYRQVQNARSRLRRAGHNFPNLQSRDKGAVINQKNSYSIEKDTAYKPPQKPWDDVEAKLCGKLKRCMKRGLLLNGNPITVQELMQQYG